MLKIAIATAAALAFSGSAFAGSYCENTYAESAATTKAAFSPQIAAVYNEIKKVQESGLDPSRYVVPFEGEEVTLVQKANNLMVRYRSELAKAAGEAEGCASAVAPADTVVNGAVKAYAIWATYGLALLLPDRMTNIDVGEIMHGKPLGGDGALIPHFREQLLNGDTGTLANIIRDPIRCAFFLRKC